MEDHHAAIISKEDFDAVGALMEQRAKEKGIKKRASRYQSRYPFTGKLFCGECGAVLKHHINTNKNQHYAAWVCGKHMQDKNGCSLAERLFDWQAKNKTKKTCVIIQTQTGKIDLCQR